VSGRRETGRLWDTVRLSRWIRRLALPVVLLALFFFYLHYGWQTVPGGMDTMPESAPPGAICAIDKRPAAVKAPGPDHPGSLVFVEVPGGGVLLSRVSTVLADGSFQIRHENRKSSYLRFESQGPYPIERVQGLVLGVFRFESSDSGR
jgi:hypothetical protein